METAIRNYRRWTLTAALCAIVALASGCSALRVGYNQASWVGYRWFDAYIDFDANQEKSVKEALAAWFSWHRKAELVDYSDLLMKVEAEVHADTTAERTCGWWSAVRTRTDRALERAIPSMAGLAMTLKPEQIDNIEKRYAKTNAEFRNDFMHVDRTARAAAAAKRVATRAGWLYGDLDQFQRERIERWVSDSPFDPELALDERKRRQQDVLQTMRRVIGSGVSQASAETDIRGWIRRFTQSPRDAYRQHSARVLQYSCRLAADVHNSTSAAQRRVASEKLKGWAADLRALAAQPVD